MLDRRQFVLSSSAAFGWMKGGGRIGHRQANMTREPGPAVFELARRIRGLSGVELQVQFHGTSLWDRDTLLSYRRAARNTGVRIPSVAGIWPRGASLMEPAAAEDAIRKSIQAAEGLGARVILVAAFEQHCPQMDQEASYGPVVSMLQKIGGACADAGVTLGLETSLSPADDRKLIDLVGRPAVKVYYDAYNVERFGHAGQSVPGYGLLGITRIAQLHLKNGAHLLEEPGLVNWAEALEAIRRIGYQGWLVFESSHSSPEQCIEATGRNIAFVRRLLG